MPARRITLDNLSEEAQRLWEVLKKNKYVIKPGDPLLLRKIEMDRKRAEFEEKSKNYMVQIIS